MAKKKFTLDKESLYQKIMPSSSEHEPLLDQMIPEDESVPPIEDIPTESEVATTDQLASSLAQTSEAEQPQPLLAQDNDPHIGQPLPLLDQENEPIVEQSRPLLTQASEPEVEQSMSPLAQANDFGASQPPEKNTFDMPMNLLEQVLRPKIVAMLTRKNFCACELCQDDAMAIALNKLTVKYIPAHSATPAMVEAYYKKNFSAIVPVISQVCTIVGNSPRHDLKDQHDVHLRNVMEDLVYAKIQSSAIENEHIDQCPICLSAVAADMLNNLPCHYVVTTKGQLFAKVVTLRAQYGIDLTAIFVRSCDYVAQHPSPH